MIEEIRYIILIAFTGILAGCVDSPDFSETPYIEFEQLTRDYLLQGTSNEDTIRASIYFEDGDGDLGHRDSFQIFLRDSRDGFLLNYKIPFIPKDGTANGISGQISFDIYSTCCYFPVSIYDPCDSPEEFPTDTLIYDIYIKDRAGHMSNVVKTDPIILQCR